MIYSKIKYDALCSFYDLIEHGENYVVAAEQAIKQATTYHGLKQIIFNITIIERILLLNVVLSPYLIDKGLVAIKNFQSISESELEQQINSPVYLTELSVACQRVSSILQKEYNNEV
jgi:hypothetical protein